MVRVLLTAHGTFAAYRANLPPSTALQSWLWHCFRTLTPIDT